MKKELILAIDKKKRQLDKLVDKIDESYICSQLYNKLVIEKAVLKKQLDELNCSSFAQKIIRLFPRKKTLICDYFDN